LGFKGDLLNINLITPAPAAGTPPPLAPHGSIRTAVCMGCREVEEEQVMVTFCGGGEVGVKRKGILIAR